MSTAVEVVMPRLSDSMEEGTIVRWLKADGEQVAVGDEIAEIETDKATMEYEAEAEGPLRIVVPEGETCAVGVVIATIGDGEAPASAPEPEPAAVSAEAPAPAPSEPAPTAPSGDGSNGGAPAAVPAVETGGRIAASPLARRIARELGVELSAIAGSGPGGRIVKADVLAAGDSTPPAAAPAAPAAAGAGAGAAKGEVRSVELTRVQQLTARKMAESKATAPDFVLEREVDMEAAVQLRALLKSGPEPSGDEAPVPSYNDMVVRACALALRRHPRVNGAYRDGTAELYGRINIGIAVAADGALIVPTVYDADRLGLGEIAREARRLAERVRDGKVTPPELSGGTFTVSNLGMFGIDSFVPVINPPQAAILGVGALAPKATVGEDGGIAARHRMPLTLNCDHRILSGAEGAEFLGTVAELLEGPGALIR